MDDATTVAVDLAKDTFEVACANRADRVVERKRLTRRQFERFLETLTAGTNVIMEACGTAHYWGRWCQAHDLSVCGCCRLSMSDRTCAETRRIARTSKPYWKPPTAARFARCR